MGKVATIFSRFSGSCSPATYLATSYYVLLYYSTRYPNANCIFFRQVRIKSWNKTFNFAHNTVIVLKLSIENIGCLIEYLSQTEICCCFLSIHYYHHLGYKILIKDTLFGHFLFLSVNSVIERIPNSNLER